MHLLLPAAVFMLMVSVGMSLHLEEVFANWRRLTGGAWLRLLLATFVLPPVVALLVSRLLGLDHAALAGLFMVAVAPGAPLMTRGVGKKGFDMQLAASYQLWGALLIPVMIPLIVGLAGKWYDRDIWIEPTALLAQIAKQQFLPLLVGMLLMRFLPALSQKVQRAFNLLGNLVLMLVLVVGLVAMGPKLLHVNPLLPVAAFLLALGSIFAIRLFGWADISTEQTLSICNANRHIGLALLLTKQYLQVASAVPAVACYAIAAPVVMIVYTKLLRKRVSAAEAAPVHP